MMDKFDNILDICIDRINRGDRIEDCLADYPKYAEELELLLRSMLSARDAYSFVPRASAKQEAWQRFSKALRESEQRRERNRLPLPWILGRTRSWAAASAVVILIGIAAAGYFGVTQLSSPEVILSRPDPEGNLAFFISDSSNAIADFERLDLNVSKVSLQKQGGEWVEFVPENGQVDLTLLQGDLAKEVWRGNVPQSQYSSAVLYVVSASGILKNTGESVDIKLPDKKLHLKMPFDISSNAVTEFVYDISVKAPDSGKYTLQPEVEESGPGKNLQKVEDKEKDNGPDNEKGLDEDNEQDDNKDKGKGNSLGKGSGPGQGQAISFILDQGYGPGNEKVMDMDSEQDQDKDKGKGESLSKDNGADKEKDMDKGKELDQVKDSDNGDSQAKGNGLDKEKDLAQGSEQDQDKDKDKDKDNGQTKGNGVGTDKSNDKGLDSGDEQDQVKDKVEDNSQAKNNGSGKDKELDPGSEKDQDKDKDKGDGKSKDK